MYIVVVGAGEVGSYVAERFSREGHDVAVVDLDPGCVREIEERLDALAVRGSGTSPAALHQAGIDRADLLLAVTDRDEVNLLSCVLAKQVGVSRTVARLQSPELRSAAAQPMHRRLGVDLVIDPDEETAREILELVENPGALEIAAMAGGEVVVVGARIGPDAPVVGRTLQEIAHDHEPQWEFLFGAITRRGETTIPRGDHRLEPGDHVRVVCKRHARRQLAQLLGLRSEPLRRVILLGGGRTAELVAEALKTAAGKLTVVEHDPTRAAELAERLDHALVIQGDITDPDVLADVEVGLSDVVVALTGDDDANILSCLFAKSAGAREALVVVHRLSLLPMLHQVGVDAALSPRTATADAVLRFVRGGVTAVATFLEGPVEVLEIEVEEWSRADGAAIAELAIPKDVLIGAVVRDGRSEIGRGRTVLRGGDHVVLLAMPRALRGVEQAFRAPNGGTKP